MYSLSVTVNVTNETKISECGPLLVPARDIAEALNVSTRYVHLLRERGEIPAHKIGRGCVRFNPVAVFAALGITKGYRDTAAGGKLKEVKP